MLDVRRLRLLHEVARHGSIAGAARSLAFTPSAVSQQIAKLEREAGVALVERGARSIRLTTAGARLVEHAEAILAQLASAEAELRRLAHAAGSVVRVGTFPTVSAKLLPDTLARLGSAAPAVTVEPVVLDPAHGIARLTAGDLDAALAWEYDFVPLEPPQHVELRLLLEEPILVFLPRDHPSARRRMVQLADLARERWIAATPASSCHPFTRRACEAAGFSPEIVLEIDDYQAMQELVASGVGLAFAPEMATSTTHPDVVARRIGFRSPRRRIYVATRTGDTRAAIAALLDALSGAAASLRAGEGRRRRSAGSS